MKKLIFILFILFSISGFSQHNITIGKGKLEGIFYNTKSGAIDTIISLHPDSLGQFKIMNISDPVNGLDAVNYRTLLEIASGIDLDSLMFDHEKYMNKSVYDTGQISEQLVGINATQTLSNKTLILPVVANFTNATHDHTTAATGGTLNSDNITQGITNLWSQWLKTGSNIYSISDVGIGGFPTTELDVFGTTRTQILNVTNSISFDGLSITDVVTGTTNNDKFVSKGYVDDAITAGGGYTDENAQDAIGLILDNDSIGDIDFVYNDGTPLISATVQDDSHSHTTASISGLTTDDFTSQDVSQWTNDVNYAKLGSSQTFTQANTFQSLLTIFGNFTDNAAGIEIRGSLYPSIKFSNNTNGLTLSRSLNNLTWEATPGNIKILYHAGNLNLSTIDFAANAITAASTVTWLNGSSTNANTAYNDKVNSLAVTGTTTKTITLTQQDGGTVSGTFTDNSNTFNNYALLSGYVTDRNINVNLVGFTPEDGDIISVIVDSDILNGDTITFSVNGGTQKAILDYYEHDEDYSIKLVYLTDYWGLYGSYGEEHKIKGVNTGDQDLTGIRDTLTNMNTYTTFASNGITLKGVDFYNFEDSTLVPKVWVLQQISLNNENVQTLVGTSPYFDVSNGKNGIITLTGVTTITMANLVAGQHGMLTVNNGSSTSYLVTFAGYTIKVHNSIRNSANTVLVSGGTTTDLFSWYYDGTTVLINGGLNFN